MPRSLRSLLVPRTNGLITMTRANMIRPLVERYSHLSTISSSERLRVAHHGIASMRGPIGSAGIGVLCTVIRIAKTFGGDHELDIITAGPRTLTRQPMNATPRLVVRSQWTAANCNIQHFPSEEMRASRCNLANPSSSTLEAVVSESRLALP